MNYIELLIYEPPYLKHRFHQNHQQPRIRVLVPLHLPLQVHVPTLLQLLCQYVPSKKMETDFYISISLQRTWYVNLKSNNLPFHPPPHLIHPPFLLLRQCLPLRLQAPCQKQFSGSCICRHTENFNQEEHSSLATHHLTFSLFKNLLSLTTPAFRRSNKPCSITLSSLAATKAFASLRFSRRSIFL